MEPTHNQVPVGEPYANFLPSGTGFELEHAYFSTCNSQYSAPFPDKYIAQLYAKPKNVKGTNP